MRIEDRHRVVEQHASAGHHRLRAEEVVDGLGRGDDVAIGIRDRDVRRVWGSSVDAGRIRAGLFEVDLGTARRRVMLRDEPGDRHVDERGIAGGRAAVGERDLHRFREQVNTVDGAEAERRQVVGLEEVQHLDQVDAAACRRRAAGDLETAIGPEYRRALDRAIAPQIVERDQAAGARHVLDDGPAERAAIERRRAFRSVAA